MQRKKPLQRRKPLRNKTPLQRKGRLNARSQKGAELHRQWLELRARKLAENPTCECNCRRRAVDVHHRAGRGRHLLTWEYLMSVCRDHHTWIHDNGKAAETLGWIVRDRTPYDPLNQP